MGTVRPLAVVGPPPGYDVDDLGLRVVLLRRALERAEGPVYDVAGLLDAFHADQLAALVGIGRALR
jgi:hypothetical protein